MGSVGRCREHGLATAPDGRCVLCRRRVTSVPAGSSPGGSSRSTKVVLAGLALAGGVLSLIAMGSSRPAVDEIQRDPVASTAALGSRREPSRRRLSSDFEAQGIANVAAAASERARIERELEATRERQRAERERREVEREREREEHEEAVQRRRETAERAKKEAERRLAELLGKVDITLYSTRWCGHCARARAYLRAQHIDFQEYDVDHDRAARERADLLNPRGSVPTFDIDGEVLVGFSPGHFEAIRQRAARRRAGL